jgi:iron complex transport system ATP-binding protein
MSDLAAQDLSCGYGDQRVFEFVSLAARPGEVLALLGPNGAGKTTLLRALARLLRPIHGHVILNDRDVWETHANELAAQVAVMPQTERRDWPLSVEQAVLLGRVPHRGWLLPFNAADRQIAARAMQMAGLDSLRDRSITELSGGEWRRAILARALAQEPRVLLLDEPIGGLDLKYQYDVLERVRQMARSNSLIAVLTLHDLNLAALYADRLALLADRRLVALGTPEEVMTPERIGTAYGVAVDVLRHPVWRTPLVVPRVAMQKIDS